MYNIYLVEDEKNLNSLIKSYLEKEGYNVKTFINGEDALDSIGEVVHLWILDIMLTGEVSGYDIIKKIRENDEFVPIIFTSARDKDLDKIIGLELGSDDYLTKPYSLKELMLRVNKMIRRVYMKDLNILKHDNYKIDGAKRTVYEGETEIILTTMEFDLLLMFLKNKNISFSRQRILDYIWKENYYGSDRSVDDLVRRLRKKMKDLNINTIYGYGYRLQ